MFQNIDIEKLENQIKQNPKRYKVVIPVSIFGLPANFKELEDLKVKYNLKVVEDAAQSFGSSINKKMSCSFGDIGCTSFFPAKPLGCYGDGGAIFTNDDSIAEDLKSIRVHGTGIDKSIISKILEPYYTTKVGNSGLGLAITKKIIDDHNGIILIKPLKGSKGMSVTLKFPLISKLKKEKSK